ncbi:MAG: hypothetical protein K8L99_02405 [Anaerolineae bacterium]|nr:hypothetical protein [Anaerolineae bacterium]
MPYLLLCGLVLLAACSGPEPTPTLTPVPSSTATVETTPLPTDTATPDPNIPATETPIVLEITPLAGNADPPPLDITLPEDWRRGYDTLALADIDTLRAIPLAVYQGPVTGGTGTIVLLWGFPNLVAGSPIGSNTPTPDIWVDALRLFRLAMVDQGCNPGTDLQRDYTVGNRSATGTQFAIVECPESTDTRGWFAGLRVQDINFVFYSYVEPIEAADTALDELQAILDSVVFHLPAD